MIKSAGAWLYRWVLVFGLIKSCCGAKEAPPSAVGGLGRLMWGGAWKIFCLYILKAHGLRSMGLLCCEGIRRPTQRSGWAWKIDVGRGLEDFLFIHLKSPWTAFHGSLYILY